MDEQKIDTVYLAKLRARLPYRYAQKLVDQIKEKHKKEYTLQHIRRTLMRPPKHFPNLIIDEAIILAELQDEARRNITIKLHEW